MKHRFSIILVIFGILKAQVSTSEEINNLLNQAVLHYQQGEWAKTIMILEDALPRFDNEDRIDAHKYLGMSYARLNDNISSKEHFKTLLKLNPKFTLKSEDADLSIIGIINEAKKEIAYESAFCSCFIPGIGQMIKGEDKKGKLIMLGSGLSLASSVLLWLETEDRHNDYLSLGPDSIQYMDEYYNNYNKYYRISLCSSGVFLGIYLFGILDAMLGNTRIVISDRHSLYINPDLMSLKFGYQIKF